MALGKYDHERAYEVPDRYCRPVLLDRCDCDSDAIDSHDDRSSAAAMKHKSAYRLCKVCALIQTANPDRICDRCWEQARRRQKEEDEA